MVLGDLTTIAEMRRVGEALADKARRADVLVNNAGVIFQNRELTADGLEKTFAVNHMAYFVLTEGLRRTLAASAPARIVNTASGAHKGAKLDFDDLQLERGYSGFQAYGRSKLCNILFTRELARRLETGVTANALHPGFVATRFGDRSGGLLQALMPIAKLGAISPTRGAETIVHLASSPEVASMSGLYFYREKPQTPSPEALDDAAARRLWTISERLESAVAEAA
jgi:NAD(P)-dependent dehydrogenase (short-subunit alcohol dehydrogenase family)